MRNSIVTAALALSIFLASAAYADYSVRDLRNDYVQAVTIGNAIQANSVSISNVMSATLARGGKVSLEFTPQQLGNFKRSVQRSVQLPPGLVAIKPVVGPAPLPPIITQTVSFKQVCVRMAEGITNSTQSAELVDGFTDLLQTPSNMSNRWFFVGVASIVANHPSTKPYAAKLVKLLPQMREEGRQHAALVNWGFNQVVISAPGAAESLKKSSAASQLKRIATQDANTSKIAADVSKPVMRGLMGDIWDDITSNWNEDYATGSEYGSTAGQVIGGTAGAMAGGAAAGAMTMTTATAAGMFYGGVEGADIGGTIGEVAGGIVGAIGGAIGTTAGWIVGTVESNMSRSASVTRSGTSRSLPTGSRGGSALRDVEPVIQLSFE